MKRLVFLAVLFVLIGACGKSGGGVSSSDVSTSIADEATDIPLDSTLTVTWPKLISSSSVTTSTFFLVPATMALSDVSKGAYDGAACDIERAVEATVETGADALSSTLTPAALAPNTTYYVCLAPAIAFWDDSTFEGSTSSFVTHAISASFVSKTSVAFVNQDDVTLTFDLGEAAEGSFTVGIAEASADIAAKDLLKSVSAGECSTADNITVQCEVKGVAGYTEFVDYTVTLMLNGGTVGTARFNSADREFDNDAFFDWWFTTVLTGDATADMSINTVEGVLGVQLDLTDNNDDALAMFNKQYSGDIAFSVRIANNDVSGLADADAAYVGMGLGSGSEVDFGLLAHEGTDAAVGEGWWLQENRGTDLDWRAIPTGGSVPAAFCFVSKDDVLVAFASYDGTTWTRIGDDTFLCTVGNCGSYEGSSSGWTDSALAGVLFNLEPGTENKAYAYASTIDYFRFNTAVVSGDSSDCPML